MDNKINPNDVFPPSSQPNEEAAKWARVTQERLVELEKAVLAADGSLQGINRNIAASLSNIAEQIVQLQQQAKRIQESVKTTVVNISVGPVDGWGAQLVVAEKPDWANFAFVSVVGTYLSGVVTGVYYTHLHVGSEPITSPMYPTKAVGSYVVAGGSFSPVEGTLQPAVFNMSGKSAVYFRPQFDTSSVPGSGTVVADIGISVTWSE